MDFEHHAIIDGIIPPEAVRRITIPQGITRNESALAPYVDPRLTPKKVDLFVFDFFPFYREAFGYIPGRYSEGIETPPHGFYVGSKDTDFQKGIKKACGIDTQDAVVLLGSIDKYWTLTHELLHGVFDKHPSTVRRRLLDSIADCHLDEFKSVFLDGWIDHMAAYEWNTVDDQLKGSAARAIKNLGPEARYQLLNEYICHFFTQEQNFSKRSVPRALREAMEKVGYNMKTMPGPPINDSAHAH